MTCKVFVAPRVVFKGMKDSLMVQLIAVKARHHAR